MKADIHRHYGLLLSMGKAISAEIIKNVYLGIGEKPKSLIQTFDFHYKRFEEKVSCVDKYLSLTALFDSDTKSLL